MTSATINDTQKPLNQSEPTPQERPTPHDGILGIAAYVPGKSKLATSSNTTVHKLSSNESALGVSPKALDAFENAAKSLHLYPDGSAHVLRDKIGEIHNLPSDHIICGVGSGEILQMICRTYLVPGDNVVQTEHGFLLYDICARACGAETLFAPEKNLCADIDSILNTVNQRTKIVFLANPNNPTGTWLSRDRLDTLRNSLRPDILLVIDAAYAEYVDDDAYEDGQQLVERHDNVIMTRTFSKIYGLSSLRLGWAYGPPHCIDALNRIRGPFNISSVAQTVGIAALDDQAFIQRNKAHNKEQSTIMLQRLNGLGLECGPSAGNFLLVKFPDSPGKTAPTIQAYLEEHGVIVRAMGSYRLPDYLRISIGAADANERVLDLLASKFEETS